MTNNSTATGQLPFNKIRIDGILADLRAYAYIIQDVTLNDPINKQDYIEKRAFLWYLDMVGTSREALKAIWAAMVNYPPKPAVLYRDYPQLETEEEEQAQAKTGSKWVYLPTTSSGQWYWKQVRLEKALAHQGVLFPEKALPEKGFGQRKHKKKSATATAPVTNDDFVLMRLAQDIEADQSETVKRLYLQRLNNLTTVPLLRHWAEWCWEQALQNQMIEQMESFGCEAYLCRLPKEEWMAATIERGLTNSLISVAEAEKDGPIQHQLASDLVKQPVVAGTYGKAEDSTGNDGDGKIEVTPASNPKLKPPPIGKGKEKEAA